MPNVGIPSLLLATALSAQAPPRSGLALTPTYASTLTALAGPAADPRRALAALDSAPASDLGLRYLRAVVLTRLGQRAEAAALARDLESLDPGFSAAEDLELASLVLPPRAPYRVGRPRRVFRVDNPTLFPEGLAVDPATGRTFLSSLRAGGVHVLDRKGRLRPFLPASEAGPWRTLGLKVDSARGLLWIASNRPAEGDRPARSAVFAAELETGALARRIEAPATVKPFFNDLALLPDGSVCVSDSEGGTVYRIPTGADRMEPLLPPGSLDYPNGLVPTRDGQGLLVAAQGPGLVHLDLRTRTLREIAVPEGLHLQGIDGLSRHGHDLVAVQNGLPPGRVVTFTLDPTETQLLGLRILAAGQVALRGIPTTGDVVGHRFRFIANSQIALLKREGARPKPFLVLEAALGKPVRHSCNRSGQQGRPRPGSH